MRELYEYFNLKIKEKVKRCPEYNKITEIRMRVNSPLIINKVNSEEVFRDVIISEDDISDTFNIATDYSAYAFEDNIKEGFLSVPGGHRIGFGGVIVKENNRIKAIKNIKFLNIRVCRQIENYGEMLYEKTKSNEKIENILIISPPGLGKTTLLRDYIKKISNETPGTSICVLDERNEISGMYMGVPTIDLGIRTDILSNCTKKDGILMAIRSMAPKIIALDEIGKKEDIEAIESAGVSGVKVIATAHGRDVEDVTKKFGQDMVNMFERKVIIKRIGEYICC